MLRDYHLMHETNPGPLLRACFVLPLAGVCLTAGPAVVASAGSSGAQVRR